MDNQFDIETGRAVIAIEGRFDFSRHQEFRGACETVLGRGGVREVEVDLGRVAYMDSSALGMLLMLREQAQAGGKSVRLANCKGTVRQILDIANFAKLFTIA